MDDVVEMSDELRWISLVSSGDPIIHMWINPHRYRSGQWLYENSISDKAEGPKAKEHNTQPINNYPPALNNAISRSSMRVSC